MNQLHTDRRSFGSWGLTGLAGAVSTTAVAVLLSAVLSTPAYSASAIQMPAGPEGVSSENTAAVTHYCFMGQYQWHYATTTPPACRR
jgi:hypothetical protein